MSGSVASDLQCQVLWCLAPDIQISSSTLSVVVVFVVVVGAGAGPGHVETGSRRKQENATGSQGNYEL